MQTVNRTQVCLLPAGASYGLTHTSTQHQNTYSNDDNIPCQENVETCAHLIFRWIQHNVFSCLLSLKVTCSYNANDNYSGVFFFSQTRPHLKSLITLPAANTNQTGICFLFTGLLARYIKSLYAQTG